MDLITMLIGGAISLVGSLVVSLIFYIPQARSLQREAADLRNHFQLLMRALQNEGIAEWKWEDGKPVAVVVKLSAVVGGRGGGSATPTVGREDDPNETQEKDGV